MSSKPEETTFTDLLRLVRAGDEDAAAELVRRYEPEIRCEVRMRLKQSRLRRWLDSMDICQSVLASFFVRAAVGQYEVETPRELLNLLVTMARNKLVNQGKKHQARRRDYRREEPAGERHLQAVDPSPSPSELVAGSELLREARARLTEEERRLAELRAAGHGWEAIAREMGGTPAGRRMQLGRAMDRVARDLGLEAAGE